MDVKVEEDIYYKNNKVMVNKRRQGKGGRK